MTESSPDESSSKRKDFICGVVEGKKVIKFLFRENTCKDMMYYIYVCDAYV